MKTENITVGNEVLAVIVRKEFDKDGVTFLTPEHFPFQLGMHQRDAATKVEAHQHKPFEKLENIPAQEFFYIIDGKVQVVLYHKKKKHNTVILKSGDMILLNCGHEITFLEKTKLVELKQGPYRGKETEKEFI
ncbi:hypothetical protein J4207_04105 [Candidatus Woesearchaeota archaeon]|nr:hypothetical protein [Candidatus Woesearchaeota archaeon]